MQIIFTSDNCWRGKILRTHALIYLSKNPLGIDVEQKNANNSVDGIVLELVDSVSRDDLDTPML